MREFKLIDASSIEEVCSILKNSEGNAHILAGGTDLISSMKRDIYPEDKYPKTLVNIQVIEGLDYIREEDGCLKIGAMTKLKQIACNEVIKLKYSVLAEAASKTASPHLRAMGTIAGNICQENRCWYYRSDNNYFQCKMKGGKMCYAAAGDNRYHSIMGGVNGCFAVNPSDTAPALLALGATIVTNKRFILAAEFWTMKETSCTVLDIDEMVTEIQIPQQKAGTKGKFIKFAKRATIDFAIINCAVVVGDDIRIVLNGVHPLPFRAKEAENIIKEKGLNAESAEQAGDATIGKAKALSGNKYKVEVAKALVKRALLECQ